MREMRIIAWFNHARMVMKEIADGGDGKRLATTWLRDFEIDAAVAKKEDETVPRSEFYEGMVYLNETILKKHPKTPLLEKSGVRYDPDPAKELWSTVLDVIANGRGDVEDLATWRAAELRLRGENATVALRGVPGRWLTCIVIRADGTEEDVTKLVERHYEEGKCLECGRSTMRGRAYCLRHRWMEIGPGVMPDLDAELASLAGSDPSPVSDDELASLVRADVSHEAAKKYPCRGDYYRPSSPHAKAGCAKDDCKILSGESP